MKVTFITYFLGRCGGNRVLFEVANRLIKKGHEVEFISRTAQKWFPLKAPVTVIQDPRQMPERIPESDFVVATWCQTAFVVDTVKGRKGIPVYYCQHDESLFFPDQKNKDMVKKTYGLPLNIIANSPWLAAVLKAYYKRDSVTIIPGVDQKTFKPRKTKKESDVFKVMLFATKAYFKGFYDTTLPAVYFLSRNVPKTEVHIYGAELPIPYKFKTVHHGRISDKELAKLYGNCDVYVSGSHAESSPLPHLEAMACGCPIVTTIFGSEHYGNSLRRVVPRAPRVMGEALVDLAMNRDQLAKMRKQGLKDVKPFTWERTAECVELYLKGLLGED